MAAAMESDPSTKGEHTIPDSVQVSPQQDNLNLAEMIDSLIGPNKKTFHEGKVDIGMPQVQQSPEQLTVERAMESCAFKSGISGVLGM